MISWNTGTVKYPSKQVIGEGHHHWSAEEADGIAGSDTLCTCKYLKRYQVFIKFYNSRVTVTYESQIAQADIRCSDSTTLPTIDSIFVYTFCTLTSSYSTAFDL